MKEKNQNILAKRCFDPSCPLCSRGISSPSISAYAAYDTAKEIIEEARQDLKDAPIDSVAFGNADGRIEAATRIMAAMRGEE